MNACVCICIRTKRYVYYNSILNRCMIQKKKTKLPLQINRVLDA